MSSKKELSYASYLKLDTILDAQQLRSAELGQPAHHEMFFIVVHQTTELWFKQILFELDAVIEKIQKGALKNSSLVEINAGLERIYKIQTLINQHIPVLETLSPSDFMTFRDLLTPASGFQSLQFRLYETRLGLYDDCEISELPFFSHLNPEQQKTLLNATKQISLFKALEQWLNLFHKQALEFLRTFQNSVRMKIKKREAILETRNKPRNHDIQLEQFEAMVKSFDAVFNEEKYLSEPRKLAYESFLAALYLQINHHQQSCHEAYQVIKNIIELDEVLANWRYQHALMVQRMIGGKVGTGGTSGYDYLMKTVFKKRIFNELSELSSYLISDSYLDY